MLTGAPGRTGGASSRLDFSISRTIAVEEAGPELFVCSLFVIVFPRLVLVSYIFLVYHSEVHDIMSVIYE